MQKSLIAIFFLAAVPVFCFDVTQIDGNNVKSCSITYRSEVNLIKLQGSDKKIGRVKFNKALGKYVSFAHFPFVIPYAQRRKVKEFLAELNRSSRLPGRYYIDMSNGEFGYYELAESPTWHPRDVYKMWPEIYRIISINAQVSTVLKTIQMFPFAERTHGDLTKMKEIKKNDRDPGEFEYDMFSVEEDLMLAVSQTKAPSFTIDKKKIVADLKKLLADKKFPYHVELKNAAAKRDMEAICKIAEHPGISTEAKDICLFYAAVNGHAKTNFKIAKKYFMEWKPEMMMPFLQKAVEAKLPEAEHFLGQYLYRFDQGTPEEIFSLWERAYKGGYADAEASLARCCWFGFGTKRNQAKAFEMAKRYLSKIKDLDTDDCFVSIAKTVAGLGYLKFDKNKEKGLKLIHDPVTVQGCIAADCVYIYGLYGVPQSFGEHELDGGLQPHWAHLDVLMEGFRSKRDEKIIAILEYQ